MSQFEADQPSEPPPELIAFAERLARQQLGLESGETAEAEERQHTRHKLTTKVWVQPIDAAYDPAGDPFYAVTRDISSTGLGMVHTRAVHSPFLRVRFPNRDPGQTDLVLKVVRCGALGLFYDISGEFVGRINETQENETEET